MSDPCSEKHNIEKLFDFHEEKMAKLHDMEMRQVEIQGDVSHIKTRIDNGMSHTIKDIHEKLTALAPVIEHHDNIVKRIEDIGWLISRWLTAGLISVFIALLLWAISRGFVIKI